MDRLIKRRIRRLWRNRVLLSIGGVFALGLAGFQLHVAFQSRPQQPPWLLDLSRSLEAISDEDIPDKEREILASEIQDVAQKRNLLGTKFLVQMQMQELERVHLLVLEQVLEQELERVQVSWWSEELRRSLELRLSPEPAPAQVPLWSEEFERSLELSLSPEPALVQIRKLKQMLEDEQVLENELALEINSLLVTVATAELMAKHELVLQQGDELENLLNEEFDRARAFVQSGALLSIAVVSLFAISAVLLRSRGTYNLPRTAQLIAFLPEECVAEMGVVYRRMKKANASPSEIRLRLIEEFVTLLWVFYIQVKIENLRLPSGDRSIDD